MQFIFSLRAYLLVGVCLLSLLSFSCAASADDEALVFGLATGLGGLGDAAFNDMQHTGLLQARVKHGIRFLVDTPEDPAGDTAVLENLIEQGATVILAGGGYHMIDPVDSLSRLHPKVRFILLDDYARTYRPNVSSVTFRQNEGAYLCGMLAALMSETGRIAFLGAVDQPIINDFYVGYAAGAQEAAPDVAIVRRYLQEDAPSREVNPFNAPLRARRIALDLYASGADVLFAVAAGSNKGVFSAAMEEQKYAIGVDSNQDDMAQGLVLTSLMKRLDAAVLFVVEQELEGQLENRNYDLGLKEGGVSLTPMTFTRAIIPDSVLERVETTRRLIEAGEIEVDTTMLPPQQ